MQLYSPKSTLEFIVKSTVLSVALTEVKLAPSGLYQVSVGIGTASDLQVNVTVCPIQDIGEEEVRPCMTAGSVNYHRKNMLLLSHRQTILTTYEWFGLCPEYQFIFYLFIYFNMQIRHSSGDINSPPIQYSERKEIGTKKELLTNSEVV